MLRRTFLKCAAAVMAGLPSALKAASGFRLNIESGGAVALRATFPRGTRISNETVMACGCTNATAFYGEPAGTLLIENCQWAQGSVTQIGYKIRKAANRTQIQYPKVDFNTIQGLRNGEFKVIARIRET